MKSTTKKRTRGSKRGNEHEARSAKKKNNLILTDDMRNEEASTRREARKKFVLILTDGEHNEDAGTRREARKFLFPHSDR